MDSNALETKPTDSLIQVDQPETSSQIIEVPITTTVSNAPTHFVSNTIDAPVVAPITAVAATGISVSEIRSESSTTSQPLATLIVQSPSPNISSILEPKTTPVATGIRSVPPQTSGGMSILTTTNNNLNNVLNNSTSTISTTSLGTFTASGISKSSTTASMVTSLSTTNSNNTTNTPIANSINNNNSVNGNGATKEMKLKEAEMQKLLAIYKLCKKFNFNDTLGTFFQEVSKEQGISEPQLVELAESVDVDSQITNVLNTYKSEGDPVIYEESYTRMLTFIDNALDTYRHELALLIYPVFVHMYLELVYNSHEEQAIRFINRFTPHQENYYSDDIRKLGAVTKKEQMKGNEIMDNFRSGQNLFTVRLSRDSNNYLKRFLNDPSNSLVQNIVHEHLYVDIYEGLTRTKKQVDSAAGAMMGEAARQANKVKVYYGLLKEPDINVQILDDEAEDGTGGAAGGGGEAAGDADRPKKKKIRKEIISKKSRNDPNAPPLNRIPLPELRDIDKCERMNSLRESARRVKLGPGSLPSICFYTLLNASYTQNMPALCVEISEDSNYIAAGFADSTIIVWPLGAVKLRGMKSASDLEMIDKEAEDVMVRMMDDRVKFDKKVLYGHQGPVYAINFSPDKTLMLSCSEDATIRLWSLQTWTNICSYKGHCFPVWDVKFSPHGYYFASCSHDRSARLWATDSHQPLRLLVGHISDVDCIQFHPNSNYIATGSTDRSIRLWDVLNGQCVRTYTGHKARVHTLLFSLCGKFLISAGADCSVMFWHLGHGHLVAQLNGHQDTIFTLSFSRDGTILASGGNDDRVNLWDAQKILEEIDSEEGNLAQGPLVRSHNDSALLGSYRTKTTNILGLHFTRKNLLIASGILH